MNNTRTLSAAAAFVTGLVLLGSAVTPANAAIPEPAKVAVKPVQEAQQPSSKQLYCVDMKMTGTRIVRRQCHTRADWIATQDFDPLNPTK